MGKKTMGWFRDGNIIKGFVAMLSFSVVMWFLLVTTNRESISAKSGQSSEIFKHLQSIGREKKTLHQNSHLNYVSKRRVPNGPDPIHNRREVNTRRPPDRV